MNKKLKQKQLDELLSDLQIGLADMATFYYLTGQYQTKSQKLLHKLNEYYIKQSQQSKRKS